MLSPTSRTHRPTQAPGVVSGDDWVPPTSKLPGDDRPATVMTTSDVEDELLIATTLEMMLGDHH